MSGERGTDAAVGYFDHDADIGIIGRGPTIEEAFANAARAMFGISYQLDELPREHEVSLEFEEPDPEFALVEWLNSLLAASRIEGIIPAEFAIRREGNRWVGRARGARLRPGMERGTEVKGATLTSLAVGERGGRWEARCVVDV